MACPHFYPTERLHEWIVRTPVPLGDACRGRCQAREGAPEPDDGALRSWCNFGYARGQCAHCPPAGADAVRFVAAACANGVVTIRFVQERDHRPLEAGVLEYDAATATLRQPHSSATVTRQAIVYAQTFLRRTAPVPSAATTYVALTID